MKRLSAYLLMLTLLACSGIDSTAPETCLVVEGWIDSGGHPMVLLSETMPVREGTIGQEEMLSSIAKWARVTVSDADQTVVLTGKLDRRYFPPYVFTSSKIKGVPGRRYDLRVEYKDYVATASTVIPEPVPLDKLYPRVLLDTLYSLVCEFTDPPAPGHRYKVFTQTVGKDERYQNSTMAMASDEVFEGKGEIILWNTQRLLSPLYSPNIIKGDVVWVKFCTMDRATFDFWQNFELSLATNANSMYYFDTDMNAGMQGALGYWAGYGVNEYRIKVE